jgi:F0F1-type ATP synthase assembly protein I
MIESEPNNDLKNGYAKYSKVLGLLIQLIVFMLIFTFSGSWIDKYYAHKIPYLTILGVFIGMAIGFYNLIKNSIQDK